MSGGSLTVLSDWQLKEGVLGRAPSSVRFVKPCVSSPPSVVSGAISAFWTPTDGVEKGLALFVSGEDGRVGVEPHGTGSGVIASPLL